MGFCMPTNEGPIVALVLARTGMCWTELLPRGAVTGSRGGDGRSKGRHRPPALRPAATGRSACAPTRCSGPSRWSPDTSPHRSSAGGRPAMNDYALARMLIRMLLKSRRRGQTAPTSALPNYRPWPPRWSPDTPPHRSSAHASRGMNDSALARVGAGRLGRFLNRMLIRSRRPNKQV